MRSQLHRALEALRAAQQELAAAIEELNELRCSNVFVLARAALLAGSPVSTDAQALLDKETVLRKAVDAATAAAAEAQRTVDDVMRFDARSQPPTSGARSRSRSSGSGSGSGDPSSASDSPPPSPKHKKPRRKSVVVVPTPPPPAVAPPLLGHDAPWLKPNGKDDNGTREQWQRVEAVNNHFNAIKKQLGAKAARAAMSHEELLRAMDAAEEAASAGNATCTDQAEFLVAASLAGSFEAARRALGRDSRQGLSDSVMRRLRKAQRELEAEARAKRAVFRPARRELGSGPSGASGAGPSGAPGAAERTGHRDPKPNCCFVCGKPGHWARDCPQAGRRPEK